MEDSYAFGWYGVMLKIYCDIEKRVSWMSWMLTRRRGDGGW